MVEIAKTLLPAGFRLMCAVPASITLKSVVEVLYDEYIIPGEMRIDEWICNDRSKEVIVNSGSIDKAGLLDAINETTGGIVLTDKRNKDILDIQILLNIGEYSPSRIFKVPDSISLDVNGFNFGADYSAEEVRHFLRCNLHLFDVLANRLEMVSGFVLRQSSHYAPRCDSLDPHTLAKIIDPDLPARHFDDVDWYWSTWDEVIDLPSGKKLCYRAKDILDEYEFKAYTYPIAWEAAYRSKNGVYKVPGMQRCSEYERHLIDDPEPRIKEICYDEKQQLITFEAYPPEETGHLLPRELAQLADIVYDKKTDDDRAVKELQVIFKNKEIAVKGKRMVLEAGARIFYLDDTGERVELLDVV